MCRKFDRLMSCYWDWFADLDNPWQSIMFIIMILPFYIGLWIWSSWPIIGSCMMMATFLLCINKLYNRLYNE